MIDGYEGCYGVAGSWTIWSPPHAPGVFSEHSVGSSSSMWGIRRVRFRSPSLCLLAVCLTVGLDHNKEGGRELRAVKSSRGKSLCKESHEISFLFVRIITFLRFYEDVNVIFFLALRTEVLESSMNFLRNYFRFFRNSYETFPPRTFSERILVTRTCP